MGEISMKRSEFLAASARTGLVLAFASSGISLSACIPDDGRMVREVRFSSLTEALEELHRLQKKKITPTGTWNLYQVLNHCAQSIEYGMTGFPEMRPAILRHTAGKLALNKFLRQGYMSHNLKDPIPGAPALLPDGKLEEGYARIEKAITSFLAFQGTLHPHFMYDQVAKPDFDKANAMHIANHLSTMDVS